MGKYPTDWQYQILMNHHDVQLQKGCNDQQMNSFTLPKNEINLDMLADEVTSPVNSCSPAPRLLAHKKVCYKIAVLRKSCLVIIIFIRITDQEHLHRVGQSFWHNLKLLQADFYHLS